MCIRDRSYAATAEQAAGRQLTPLFDQLLASAGGTHLHLEDLRFYEDGGIGDVYKRQLVILQSGVYLRPQQPCGHVGGANLPLAGALMLSLIHI